MCSQPSSSFTSFSFTQFVCLIGVTVTSAMQNEVSFFFNVTEWRYRCFTPLWIECLTMGGTSAKGVASPLQIIG